MKKECKSHCCPVLPKSSGEQITAESETLETLKVESNTRGQLLFLPPNCCGQTTTSSSGQAQAVVMGRQSTESLRPLQGDSFPPGPPKGADNTEELPSRRRNFTMSRDQRYSQADPTGFLFSKIKAVECDVNRNKSTVPGCVCTNPMVIPVLFYF